MGENTPSKRERIEALEARVAALEGQQFAALAGRADRLTPRRIEPLCAQTDGACHSCGLDKGHEGDHKCYRCPDVGVCGHLWSSVPQWRALVTDQQWRIVPNQSPLSIVLHSLARIDRNANGEQLLPTRDYLARIVAVAEGQVGDGWRADPDDAVRPKGGVYDAEYLIYALAWTTPGDGRWRVLGDRAAAWLRDLTDGAA